MPRSTGPRARLTRAPAPAQGVDTGFSQIAQRGAAGEETLVWNFPLDVSFKATNAFGWPRLVLSSFNVDSLGRDVVCGYGSVHLPTTPGRHVRYVRMFTPLSSSKLQEWVSWALGRPPQFFEADFVARDEGREGEARRRCRRSPRARLAHAPLPVTRVRSTGVVKLVLNVTTRGMEALGYRTGPRAKEDVRG